MTQLSVSEARAILPELLDRVQGGEEVTITRHGRPAAVMLRPDAVRARRAEAMIDAARAVGELVATARTQELSPTGMSTERAEALIESIRADRDRS